MRDYEILYIVRPELDEDQLNQAVERVNSLIANVGGEHQKTDVWGKRRLAYEVDRLREGYYVLTDFRVEPERVPEMESTLKISDTVFRHLIVRKPPKAGAAAAAVEAPVAAAADETPVEEAAVDAETAAEDVAADASVGAAPAAAETATEQPAADEPAADAADEAEAEVGAAPNSGELQEES